MQPRLVGKGAGPDVRSRPLRHAVQDVVQQAAGAGQPGQSLGRHAGLESAGIGFLEQQRRDQRRQVRVAAALAQTVQRALNLPRARIDRRQRIGDGVPRIVMAMDTQAVAGDTGGDDLGGDPPHLGRQRAAIGVAQHHPPRARLQRRAEAGQRVIRVRAVAVEEMLGIEQRLAPLRHKMRDTCADGLKVLVQRDPECGRHMERVRLAHQTDRRRARIQHRRQNIIILRRPTNPLGHAEGGHGGARRGHLREEFAVRRIRPRPSALDVVHPKRIQRLRHGELFRRRELHALRLLPVAEGGVEEEQAPPPVCLFIHLGTNILGG